MFEVEMIKCEMIRVYNTRFPDKFLSTEPFRMWTVDEFVDSIKKEGIKNPIKLKYLKSGYYEVLDGKHRLAVWRRLGYKEIPAIVMEAE